MQISRIDKSCAAAFLILGLATQAVWLYAVPFSWGWDSAPNLAIGRMYFGLPYEMWDIKSYYPPAYPVFLTLMGVHHTDTLAYLRIGTLLVGGLMPLLLFMMVRPFHFGAAVLAALAFAASFAHALFSTDMMNHHFHASQLLFMSTLFAWYLYRPSVTLAVLFGVAAALANAGRGVTVFVFIAGVGIAMLAIWLDRRRILPAAKHAAILILSFVMSTGALSLARQAALGGPFQYGLTNDIGGMVLFQGAYFGASIYQKEFHPGEDAVFVKPDNGPASRQLMETMRVHFEKLNVKDIGLAETDDKDAAIQNLIRQPTILNAFTIWFGLNDMMTAPDRDQLLRRVVLETLISQPRVVRYFTWNFWTFLFGSPMMTNDNCNNKRCACPPCFETALPQSWRIGFMGAEVFRNVASPALIDQMTNEHARAQRTIAEEALLHADARLLFVVKPLLTMLMFASLLLSEGKTRLFMFYCVAAALIIGGTTSLAWPVNARYQYPTLPYILAAASLSMCELVRRLRDFAGLNPHPRPGSSVKSA